MEDITTFKGIVSETTKELKSAVDYALNHIGCNDMGVIIECIRRLQEQIYETTLQYCGLCGDEATMKAMKESEYSAHYLNPALEGKPTAAMIDAYAIGATAETQLVLVRATAIAKGVGMCLDNAKSVLRDVEKVLDTFPKRVEETTTRMTLNE